MAEENEQVDLIDEQRPVFDEEFGLCMDPCEHPSINGGECAACGELHLAMCPCPTCCNDMPNTIDVRVL